MTGKAFRSAFLVPPFLLGLFGCVAGPNYRVPDSAAALAPAAQQNFVGGRNAAYSQASLPDQWWNLYDDPRLSAFVREALRANTELRAADANIRQASAVVRETEAARSIQTDMTTSAAAARVGGYTLAKPGAPYTYVLGMSLSLPLDLAGGIRRGIEAASANAEAAQAARDQVRVVVAAAVTRAYASACSANRTLAATRHVLDVQRETLEVTRRLAAGGRGTAFDVSRARAAANESEAAIPAIVATRQTALLELAALMGRLPADYPKELEDCLQPPELKRPLPIGDGWQLIQRRPDIRRAERNLAVMTATLGVETAQLYPQVSIGGSAGFAGQFSAISSSNFGGSIGPLMSWNMPNRTAVKARIAQASAAADAALAEFDGSVLQALKQTESSLSAYSQEINRERSLVQARGDAEDASDQANRLFRFGRTSFIDVLSAESALANVESSLASSRAQLIDRQIELFLALGGGWREPPPANSNEPLK
ncbi:efflux transporter outer membrane subunit [Cupriavidus sp. YAF13]|uniref:efflux transporter outer membrane subunit n=1 Tax=Cupriavidus sp. YAF13 TaxID=3233075 RepID=UPI003F92C2B6